MRNDKFFDMKLREAGFNLKDEDECEFCNNLFDLVWKVIHGETIWEDLCEGEDESLFETKFYRYSRNEECFILFGLECDESFQVAYLLNQFGIELVYRNGDYRVYTKK